MKKILLASIVFALLNGMGWNIDISNAHPSGHSHKHIFSSHSDHNHSNETKGKNKFYCPMHKHYSFMPCPHMHHHKEMGDQKKCKIGPECGGSSDKPATEKSGNDNNRGLNNKAISLDSPEIRPAPVFQRTTLNSPQPDSPWHPPKSL